MTRNVYYFSHLVLWVAIVLGVMVTLTDIAFAQTATSTVVTDGSASDIIALIESGSGWAAAGAILGLVVRLLRLVGLRNLLPKNAARIWSVVAIALLGVATGMVEGSLAIAAEAVVAGILGILGGEAAARKTERSRG